MKTSSSPSQAPIAYIVRLFATAMCKKIEPFECRPRTALTIDMRSIVPLCAIRERFLCVWGYQAIRSPKLSAIVEPAQGSGPCSGIDQHEQQCQGEEALRPSVAWHQPLDAVG